MEQVQVTQRNQDINYTLLLEQSLRLVSQLKLLWIFGLFTVIASNSLNRSDLVELFPITSWNNFPYNHLASLTLPDVPSGQWATWLGWTNLPPVLITGFAMLLWLGHLLAQAGLIKMAAEAKEGQAISVKFIFSFCLSSGWRIVLLNLVLFGAAYLAICLGMILFSPDLYPTLETEGAFVQKYQSWPHNVLGAFTWLLIPMNILATIIYPLAKRSIILSRPALNTSLRYSIALIRHNFMEAIRLFIVFLILSYAFAGFAQLVQLLQTFFVAPDSIGYILDHPFFLGMIQIISLLLGAFLTAMLSVFGTYVYLAYEERYQALHEQKKPKTTP